MLQHGTFYFLCTVKKPSFQWNIFLHVSTTEHILMIIVNKVHFRWSSFLYCCREGEYLICIFVTAWAECNIFYTHTWIYEPCVSESTLILQMHSSMIILNYATESEAMLQKEYADFGKPTQDAIPSPARGFKEQVWQRWSFSGVCLAAWVHQQLIQVLELVYFCAYTKSVVFTIPSTQ